MELPTATKYDDVYLRDNFDDGGTVPTAGVVSLSPDIIPYQADLLEWDKIEQWNPPDLGKTFLDGKANNIYVRGKNLGTVDATRVTLRGFAVHSALLMGPHLWKNRPLKTNSGKTEVKMVSRRDGEVIKPSSICTGQEAFSLTLDSAGEHYCLVAVIATLRHPITIPDTFPSNPQFVQWVRTNPAVTYRNLVIVRDVTTGFSRTEQFSSLNKATVQFQIETLNAPVGTKVRLQSTDARCPFDFQRVIPEKDEDGKQVVYCEKKDVPAKYDGFVRLTFTSHDGKKLPAFDPRFRYYEKEESIRDEDAAIFERFAEEVVLDSATGETGRA